MRAHNLDRLLTTLDVQIHAFSVCQVRRGVRLAFTPMNAVIVHYTVAGRGVLYLEGREPVAFGTNSIVIVPAGLKQVIAADTKPARELDAANHCAMLVDGLIKFDGAQGGKADLLTLCGSISATYGGSFGLFDRLPVALVEDLGAMPAVRAIFDWMLAERSAPTIGTGALTEALMKQCLILVIRHHLSRRSTSSPLFEMLADTRLSLAIQLVLQRPGAAHKLHELAKAAGMSRSAFAKRFMEVFGRSPMDFVQRTRLHHAAKLLAGTDLPIKVIAASMGHASRSHFSRAFRSAYGMDPSKFRRVAASRTVDAPAAGR